MIAEGNRDLANEYLLSYAHTLGNLTITGYNQTLSNLSYEKKNARTNKDGNFVGYKNGLKLNDDVANLDAWTVNNIKNRTDKLVNYFRDEFSL